MQFGAFSDGPSCAVIAMTVWEFETKTADDSYFKADKSAQIWTQLEMLGEKLDSLPDGMFEQSLKFLTASIQQTRVYPAMFRRDVFWKNTNATTSNVSEASKIFDPSAHHQIQPNTYQCRELQTM